MNSLDHTVLDIVNHWYLSLEDDKQDNSLDSLPYYDAVQLFIGRHWEITGTYVNLTPRMQAHSFRKIYEGLSKQHEDVDENLLMHYIEWSFDNYQLFMERYNAFNLSTLATFAPEWKQDLLEFEESPKIRYKDLENVEVASNVLHAFELYGIPYAATKLWEEKQYNREKLMSHIMEKLKALTNKHQDLLRLGNILRRTVENGPYASRYLFADYKSSLKDVYKYFQSEPWCK